MKKYRHTINILLIVFMMIMTIGLIVGIIWFGGHLEIRHFIGLLLICSTLIVLFINHNLFNLLTGLTLLIGNFGGLSFLSPIETYYLKFNIGPIPIPLYWGQPIYSVLLIIYFAFNKGFYIGILTKEYWMSFLTRTQDLEAVFVTINNPKTEQQKDNPD